MGFWTIYLLIGLILAVSLGIISTQIVDGEALIWVWVIYMIFVPMVYLIIIGYVWLFHAVNSFIPITVEQFIAVNIVLFGGKGLEFRRQTNENRSLLE